MLHFQSTFYLILQFLFRDLIHLSEKYKKESLWHKERESWQQKQKKRVEQIEQKSVSWMEFTISPLWLCIQGVITDVTFKQQKLKQNYESLQTIVLDKTLNRK